MTSAIGSASSGLQAALSRVDAAGQAIARTAVDRPQGTPEGQGVSPASQLETAAVDLISGEYDFRANLKVLQTADRLRGALLDEKA